MIFLSFGRMVSVLKRHTLERVHERVVQSDYLRESGKHA